MIVAFFIVLAWAVVATIAAVRKPGVLIDHGSRIFTCPTTKAQEIIVRICHEYGLHPFMRADSGGISRAFLRSGVIINSAPPEMRQQWGNPSSALALRVSDPIEEARHVARVLKDHGFTGKVHANPDPDIAAGKMAFVETDAFLGTMLVFRVWAPKMGPKPPAWEYREI